MNRKELSQKLCQLASSFENCTDVDFLRAGKHQMNLLSQRLQVEVLNDLGIGPDKRGEMRDDRYAVRRRLAGNYPRVFMQQADIWSDIAESIKDYRDDMRDRFDPMSCNHPFLRNAAQLAERQAKSIDTRPGIYMPRIHIRMLEKHGTITGRFQGGERPHYWNERTKDLDLTKCRVQMYLQYKTKRVSTDEDIESLELPLTWGHQVKRLGITSLENKIVFSAEPCMTTEVHGALIEGFRAKWYKVDRKLGWTIEEGYIAKCDDMYRTCKSRMHIPTVAKRKVAKDVTSELLDALG